MAHFAELDSMNIVLRVIVISNDDILDNNNVEQESLGIAVCRNIFGENTNWKQTSYNNNFRKKYASIGDKYNSDTDIFYNPVPPFTSWQLDDNYDWQAPIAYPIDGLHYAWDEDLLNWVQINIPGTE